MSNNNLRHKSVAHYYSDTINSSEYFKYKSCTNKMQKSLKNNTLTNKSSSKPNIKSIC